VTPGTAVNCVAALRFFFIKTLKRHQFREFLPYLKDSAGITWANRVIQTRAFESFARVSMKESIFSITVGTTTTARAKFGWARRCVMVIARRRS
jgi:hypothetical protein